MAMRENTGLQIALILFVMITVALAVTTYVYWDGSTQAQKKQDELTTKMADLDKRLTAKDDEVRSLRDMLGYKVEGTAGGGPPLTDIEKNYASDKSLFGDGWQEEKNYRTLPKFYSQELVKLNAALAKATEDKATLTAQLDAARLQEATNTKKYQDEQIAATEDYTTQVAKLGAQRTETVGSMDKFKDDLDVAHKEVATLKTANTKEVEGYIEKLKKLQNRLDTAEKKLVGLEPKGIVTEQPDGAITWVSQEGGTVYVNLGSADALQRSTTFTVYEQGTANVGATEPKASIEITTIRGPHLAEARILEDSLGNPILSGDVLFSPVWDPGQRSHFALLGFMDIDGDGKSDRALVRSLISQNGGAIDAEVLDDGTRKGKLSLDTRYLVRGEQADDKTAAAVRDTSSQMLKEAEQLGIEIIAVERLLSDMGWRGSERTVSGATGSTGGDFKTQPKEESGAGGGAFERRTRPGSGTTRRGSY